MRQHDALTEIGLNAGLVADSQTAKQVSQWAYTSAMASQAKAWVRANNYTPIDTTYVDCFAQN